MEFLERLKKALVLVVSVKQKKVFIYQFILIVSHKNKTNALFNKEMFDQVKWFVVGRVIQFLLSVSVHSDARHPETI